jgi:outer membrane lipoprotein SlyB
MEAQATGNKLHPVLWIAAVAVILLSLAGVGAIFGVIPTAGSSSKQGEPVAAAAPAATPAAQPATKAAEPAAEHKPAPAKKVAAKPATEAAPAPVVAQAAQPAPPPALCMNCGTVDNIREVTQKGEGTGVGAVGGAVVGGLLGNQVGKGGGKTAMTVVGAVGGGYAGHQVEKHVRSTKKYEMIVRFEDGNSRAFHYDTMPAWRIGDRVRLENGVIESR